MKCVQEFNDRLALLADAGTALPATLTAERPYTQGSVDGKYWPTWSTRKPKPDGPLPARSWRSWIVSSKTTAKYTLALKAAGGSAELRVDDVPLAKGDADDGLTCTVTLPAGAHSIKVNALDEPVTVESVTIEAAK